MARYMDLDINLYDRCGRETAERDKLRESQRAAAATKWKQIEDAAKVAMAAAGCP